MPKKKPVRSRHDDSYKAEAVAAFLEDKGRRGALSDAARKAGVSAQSFGLWVKRFGKQAAKAPAAKPASNGASNGRKLHHTEPFGPAPVAVVKFPGLEEYIRALVAQQVLEELQLRLSGLVKGQS